MNYENIKETFSKIDFKTLTLIKDILDKEYKHKLNSNIQQSLSSKSKEALIKLIEIIIRSVNIIQQSSSISNISPKNRQRKYSITFLPIFIRSIMENIFL